jgi:hypothetical protein
VNDIKAYRTLDAGHLANQWLKNDPQKILTWMSFRDFENHNSLYQEDPRWFRFYDKLDDLGKYQFSKEFLAYHRHFDKDELDTSMCIIKIAWVHLGVHGLYKLFRPDEINNLPNSGTFDFHEFIFSLSDEQQMQLIQECREYM